MEFNIAKPLFANLSAVIIAVIGGNESVLHHFVVTFGDNYIQMFAPLYQLSAYQYPTKIDAIDRLFLLGCGLSAYHHHEVVVYIRLTSCNFYQWRRAITPPT